MERKHSVIIKHQGEHIAIQLPSVPKKGERINFDGKLREIKSVEYELNNQEQSIVIFVN